MGKPETGVPKRRFATVALLAAAATSIVALTFAAPAHATFPGANGKFAFDDTASGNTDVYSSNPDGSDVTRLTTDPAVDLNPTWSADGTKIAFTSNRAGNNEIYVMNADGSGQTNLTQHPGSDSDATWSPDGTKLAFATDRNNTCSNPPDNCPETSDIYLMNADGTNLTLFEHRTYSELSDPAWSPDGERITLTYCDWTLVDDGGEDEYWVYCPSFWDTWGWYARRVDGGPTPPRGSWPAHSPNWSPDNRRVAYKYDNIYLVGEDEDIAIMSMEACCPGNTRFATEPPQQESKPIWSPDGLRILFHGSGGVVTMNPDGTGVTQLPGVQFSPDDWQAVRPPGYARPKSATPTTVRLVPAYKSCTSSNSSHGAPFALPSCAPPVEESAYATIGHGDGHPTASKSAGNVVMKVVGESPIDPDNGDQADVQLTASISDVRNVDFSDYTGELRVSPVLRITDRYSGGEFSPPIHPATGVDTPFGFTLTCVTTADGTVGSTCSGSTTADAVMPGIAREGERAIWELGQVQVYDGGADGDADTAGDNTLFATQGLFAP